MGELIDFLTACIDEDEAAAFGNDPAGYVMMAVGDRIGTTVGGRRLRAECAAKRAIVEHLAPEVGRGYATSEQAEGVLMVLAQPYADRPGWREEWRA